MATIPPDPDPDNPSDPPDRSPDEIVPPDGDTDTPAPVDDPRTSGLNDAPAPDQAPEQTDVEGNPDHC